MKRPSQSIPLTLTITLLSVVGCNDSPTVSTNHYPVITSLTVVPTQIGTSDSAAVTCIAYDSDGDTLVYDWDTDQRLSIKGAPPDVPSKSNTYNNVEIFYPNYQPLAVDTVFVVCTARDLRGGAAVKIVRFTVNP